MSIPDTILTTYTSDQEEIARRLVLFFGCILFSMRNVKSFSRWMINDFLVRCGTSQTSGSPTPITPTGIRQPTQAIVRIRSWKIAGISIDCVTTSSKTPGMWRWVIPWDVVGDISATRDRSAIDNCRAHPFYFRQQRRSKTNCCSFDSQATICSSNTPIRPREGSIAKGWSRKC